MTDPFTLTFIAKGGTIYTKDFSSAARALKAAKKVWFDSEATPECIAHNGRTIYEWDQLWCKIL